MLGSTVYNKTITMDINKFVNSPDKPFHSSGYAEIANGGAIGSTSAESFRQRLGINRNRQAIRSYRDSHVAGGNNEPRAVQAEVHASSWQRTPGVQVPARPRFTEPSARTYNPYN
jgi:hypothetical protein